MEIKRYRIYVAGPVTKGNYLENMRMAIEVANRLIERGHFPFVPHLYDLINFLYPMEYGVIFEQVSSWVDVCHILLRLPGESKGADREVDKAYDLGIPVYYGLQEFMESPQWAEEIKDDSPGI